jgi:hypothetical protein
MLFHAALIPLAKSYWTPGMVSGAQVSRVNNEKNTEVASITDYMLVEMTANMNFEE